MGTRSGDLDPGVLIYLLREFKLNAEELDKAINKYSGLTGITNGVANMQEILAKDDETSHRALDFFCYQASKHFAALTAALGGLDTIVFSGGIGEHSALVRGRIMNSLSYLGIEVDEKDNASHSSIISTSQSRVRVRVIPTNEELEIAESTSFLLNGAQHE